MKITKDNYTKFTYTNEELLKNPPKAIVHEFHGLNGGINLNTQHYPLAYFFAEHDIIYTMPCPGPWSWMNRAAVNMTDEITEALWDKYGYTMPTVSTGGSMGGLAGLIYTLHSKHTPIACATICPVCDLVYHYDEREDTAKTIYSALGGYDLPLEEAVTLTSPYHQADRMPRIPYIIFSGTKDTEVNYTEHSEKFLHRMEELGHDITLVPLPDRGHCDMSREAVEQYKEFIAAACQKTTDQQS